MRYILIEIAFAILLFSSCQSKQEKGEPYDETAKNYDKISSSLNVKLSPSDSIFTLGDSITFKVQFFSNDKIIPDSMYETRYILDSVFNPEWPLDSIIHPYFMSDNNTIKIKATDIGKHFISVHCIYNSDAGFNKVLNHQFYIKNKSSLN